jgi:hypothetical protein
MLFIVKRKVETCLFLKSTTINLQEHAEAKKKDKCLIDSLFSGMAFFE